MAGYSCSTDENNRFSAPVPWIGIYIAGASLICLLAIGADTVDGLRHRSFWFPCKFFRMNSTTLTLLSIVTKLPLDFSSPMPAVQDQLSKLTGTVFICIFLSFSMPSFGLMQDSDILSNVLALFIFVITVAGNICTQLVTGVIYTFKAEHIVVLISMLLLLGLICCSALAVDTTNDILNSQYDCKAPTRLERAQMEHIKEDLVKVWLMAHTSSPQYVMARSAMSSAAGALSCVSVLLLLQAEIRSFFTHFCQGESDYKWANWPVVVSQTALILVGSIAPALRWVNATGYRRSGGFANCRMEFEVEKFWVRRLVEWKDDPLPQYCWFLNRTARKRLHLFRNAVLDVCISFQKIALRVSKSVRLASALLAYLFRTMRNLSCTKEGRATNAIRSRREMRFLDWRIEVGSISDSSHGSIVGLNNYVLHLEGEDDLVLWMSSSGHKDMDRWMERGRKEDCRALLHLLSKSRVSEGFKGMRLFENENVPPVPLSSSDIPPNNWTLPAMTLIAIATPLTQFYGDRMQMMLMGFSQSLKLMNFVENNLDFRGLLNMRKAAAIVWSSIDLKRKWLDHDLANLPLTTSTPSTIPVDDPNLAKALQVIECLAEIGKKHVIAMENELVSIHPREWPPEALAANSLYRIGKTILEYNEFCSIEELLEWIERTLADILGACLTNLPYAIFVEYVSGMVTERVKRVRNAVFILGKAQNLEDALHWLCFAEPDAENANVDRWRSGEVDPFNLHHRENCTTFSPKKETNPVTDRNKAPFV